MILSLVVVSRSQSPVSLPEVAVDSAYSGVDDASFEETPGPSSNQIFTQDRVQGATPDQRHEVIEPRQGQSNLAPRRSSKRKSEQDDLLAIARERLLNPQPTPKEDAFDYFGKTMAHKLRDLPREQQIFAEKLCSDVMFEAALGRLSINSTISTRHVHEPEVARPFIVPGYSQSQRNDFDSYQSYDYN
ncbi:protein stand still [Plakobranchus ocellatus]|uniref:Protein stand still n=1 Tax=Plakobranchus ocellatus TaxID=259542 RepID=A0AAV4DF02_9GAST|nr:protein stand still [Plakobranchus ocellatus]